MDNLSDSTKTSRTLTQHFLRGFQELHQWRPTSFYLLLATPIVLLLGLQMGALKDNPSRFAFVLTLLFFFFALVVTRALMDVLEITRKRWREERDTFLQILGDQNFVAELRSRQPKSDVAPLQDDL